MAGFYNFQPPQMSPGQTYGGLRNMPAGFTPTADMIAGQQQQQQMVNDYVQRTGHMPTNTGIMGPMPGNTGINGGYHPIGYNPGGLQSQMSPNQQLAATAGSMSRAFYSPFNSPFSGMRQPGTYDQMGPQTPPQMLPFMQAFGAQMQQPHPSIGLSNIVQQMQGGMNPIAARQALAGLAGVPQMGPGIGAAQPQFQAPQTMSVAQPQRLPFSPVRNEGYR